MEVFSRAAEQSKFLLTYFLRLPHVKALQFSLAVLLGIGRTFRSIQNNTSLMPLPPVYTLRGENSFRLNLQSRHTKVFKENDAEIETDIWNDTADEVFQEGYMAKCCDPIFHHLRNIIAKRFKCNLARSFVCYMVDN